MPQDANLATQPEIIRASNNAKIVGNFGEALLLYWFSKHGCEGATVDHTGIDLIVCNLVTGERMGISVKTRQRMPGKARSNINIGTDQFEKAQRACDAFGCVPYFALVVDAANVIRVFIVPMSRLRDSCEEGAKHAFWRMSETAIAEYSTDPAIKVFELRTETLKFRRTTASTVCRMPG